MDANWWAMGGAEMGKVQARPAPLEDGWKIKRLLKLRASIDELQPLHCALGEGIGHSVTLGKSRSWHLELKHYSITSVRQEIQAVGTQAMPSQTKPHAIQRNEGIFGQKNDNQKSSLHAFYQKT